jgi:hypothetical protein
MGIREHLLACPLGFGAAPLGNMFRNIPGAEAEATVRAAWYAFVRYADTVTPESFPVDVSEPLITYLFWSLGLAFERKVMPKLL